MDVTGLLDLTRWSSSCPGIRVLVRRELPHPGATLDASEIRDGFRYQAFTTNTRRGQLAFLQARPRAHARVEDRRRTGKDTGLGHLHTRGMSGHFSSRLPSWGRPTPEPSYAALVPISLAHPAAVIPLGRLGLPMTALVTGSMAPDLPLFMWWPQGYDISHSLHGIVTLDVPLTVGALLLWVFAVRDAVVDMAPEAVRLRLPERVRLTTREWLLAPVAGCIGATTHVFWDAFTHRQRWGTRHVAWLSTEHAGLPGQRWLQYITGVLGLAVVGWVVLRHLRSMPLQLDRRPAVLPPFVLPGVLIAGTCVGMVSAVLQWPDGLYEMAFCAVVNGVITVLLLGLLACVAWQILARRRSQHATTR